MRRFLLAAAWTIAGFGAGVLHAATALTELRVSPDTTVTLGTPAVEDENVASDNLTGTVSVNFFAESAFSSSASAGLPTASTLPFAISGPPPEIGRASCRERV